MGRTLDIPTPRWAVPLLAPARYKGAKGGRSCVHPDTPIDTPQGQIKIKDFNGGVVYSWADGKVVQCIATKSIQFPEENLFEVTLSSNKKIIVTGKHRFLTRKGWKPLFECGVGSAVFSLPEICGPCPQRSTGEFRLYEIKFIRNFGPHSFYDLHVYGSNNYLSNGIVNHNSGKSHFFGEYLVERMLEDRHLRGVCIREIQKSIKYSSKLLIESKIRSLGVSTSFRVTGNEIRRINGTGICIFQGMQDHTADSIKSLEGFDVAWWEEAQRAKAKSLRLLRPTILRKKNAELWFSWNPDKDTDPVDVLFQNPPNSSVCVHVNYTENPFLEPHVLEEIEYDRIANPESFPHIWLGEHWAANKAQILNGKWVVEDFEAEDWFAGPYFGVDWGFSTDPLFMVKLWIGPHAKYGPHCLYVEYEASGIGIENQDIKHLFATVPGSKIHTLRADNARPELIRYVSYDGGYNAIAADKWPGSVEDGIDALRSFNKIIIHTRCRRYADECKFYSYKVDKFTEEVLPVIIDKHNHGIDASRYALEPIIKKRLEGLTQKQIQAIENSNKTTEAPAMEEKSW